MLVIYRLNLYSMRFLYGFNAISLRVQCDFFTGSMRVVYWLSVGRVQKDTAGELFKGIKLHKKY